MGETDRERNSLRLDRVVEGGRHVRVYVAVLAEAARLRRGRHVSRGIHPSAVSREQELHRPSREVADDLPFFRFGDDSEPAVRVAQKLPLPVLFGPFRPVCPREEGADPGTVLDRRGAHAIRGHAAVSHRNVESGSPSEARNVRK